MLNNKAKNHLNAMAFDTGKTLFLSDVIARVSAELEGSRRRDTLSAFNAVVKHAGVELATTPAHAPAVRKILAGLNANNLGISDKRLANIRSLVAQSVARFGMPRRWITKEIALAPEWQTLMLLVPKRDYGWSLSRLASYCSVAGISPAEVCPRTLIGLYEALEADCTVTKPRGIIKQTISIWNMCCKAEPRWPQQRLSSPFKKDPFMLALDAFPRSLRDDVDAFVRRMANADPLDTDAPLRPCRPVTLDGYIVTFRRLSSALVRNGHLGIDEITGLAVLTNLNNLKNALRHYVPEGTSGDSLDYPAKMAAQMLKVAKFHLKADNEDILKLAAIQKKLDHGRGSKMGKRNRDRLKQFDDPDAIQRVLQFPAKEYARGLQQKVPMRRVKCVERALIVSILIFAGVRAKNLRNIHLTDTIRRTCNSMLLEYMDDETKTYVELAVELPRETIDLLEEFIAMHRPLLPGSDGPYLFPSPDGGARHYSSIRTVISNNLLEQTGIRMSPHLFRHFVTKIVAEQEPERLADVSRRLGHKSLSTAYQFYLDNETAAASRRINATLVDIQSEPFRKKTAGGKP